MADLEHTPTAAAQVFIWIVEGNREADIVEAIRADKELFGKRPQPKKLIAEAREQIETLAGEGPGNSWCIAALVEIYRRALELGELAVALRTVKLLQEHDPNDDDF